MANLAYERFARLSVEQKISTAILGVCGAIALVLSVAQVRTQLRSPFFVQRSVLDRSNAFFAQQEEEAQKIEIQKKKDTDGDGLSDYDELYTYHTSPYLTDTDGDTVPDGEEVARGIDPNCPEGKTCTDAQFLIGTSTGSTLVAPGSSPGLSANTGVGKAKVAPSVLRAYLLAQNLLSQEQLDTISDDVLFQVYGSIYTQQLNQANASSTVPSTPRSSTSTL